MSVNVIGPERHVLLKNSFLKTPFFVLCKKRHLALYEINDKTIKVY